VGSAVIILGDSVQCTVEQSFFTKRFKLVEQRWRAYTWGGVRVALRMFCKCSRAFCIADTSQVGVYFLGRGTNRRLWAAQQPEASFVGGDIFRQSTSDGSTQPSPPNLENGTYVRQEQQIGETYINLGATAASW